MPTHTGSLVWDMVISRWNAATCQELDSTDLRITLLGDRGEQTHKLTEDLWRIVHAATIWSIHCTNKSDRETTKNRMTPPHKMLTATQQTIQRMLSSAWILRHTNANVRWNEWHIEGWITKHKTHIGSHILNRGFGTEQSTAHRTHSTMRSTGATTQATHTHTALLNNDTHPATSHTPNNATLQPQILATSWPVDANTTQGLTIHIAHPIDGPLGTCFPACPIAQAITCQPTMTHPAANRHGIDTKTTCDKRPTTTTTDEVHREDQHHAVDAQIHPMQRPHQSHHTNIHATSAAPANTNKVTAINQTETTTAHRHTDEIETPTEESDAHNRMDTTAWTHPHHHHTPTSNHWLCTHALLHHNQDNRTVHRKDRRCKANDHDKRRGKPKGTTT